MVAAVPLTLFPRFCNLFLRPGDRDIEHAPLLGCFLFDREEGTPLFVAEPTAIELTDFTLIGANLTCVLPSRVGTRSTFNEAQRETEGN